MVHFLVIRVSCRVCRVRQIGEWSRVESSWAAAAAAVRVVAPAPARPRGRARSPSLILQQMKPHSLDSTGHRQETGNLVMH